MNKSLVMIPNYTHMYIHAHTHTHTLTVILNFLLRVYARYIGSAMGDRALETSLVTLRAMAKGGMHDHVGQGFHRYSTDKFWHVPHFEKMLYDQGQLATVYLDTYQVSRSASTSIYYTVWVYLFQ